MLDEVLELAHVFIFDFQAEIKPLAGSLPAQQLLAETAQECLEDLRPHVADGTPTTRLQGRPPRIKRPISERLPPYSVSWRRR